MFKQLAIFAGLGIITMNASAQAYEGKVKNGKTEEPALVMVYDYPQAIVENAFVAKFTDSQLTGSLNKDFRFYPNAVIPEISKSKLDYYFKIDPTAKEKTTVYMVMHGSGDIEGAELLGSRGKSFLENMAADVKRSHNITHIRKQETLLVEEEEILAGLQKEQKELEEKLAANKAKQEAQQKIVNSQKMILNDLKAEIN
ncbi:MAG: hypothetical protein QM594_15425 [Niabella sp.]